MDALIDPADADELHAAFGRTMGSVTAAVARGDHAAAFDTFMTLDDVLSAGLVDHAARHSGDFFTSGTPAVAGWSFDPAVDRPVLLIQGADSPPPVHRLITHLAGRLPESTVGTVADAGHLMPVTAPAELGRLVAEFTRAATAAERSPARRR